MQVLLNFSIFQPAFLCHPRSTRQHLLRKILLTILLLSLLVVENEQQMQKSESISNCKSMMSKLGLRRLCCLLEGMHFVVHKILQTVGQPVISSNAMIIWKPFAGQYS